MNDKTAYMRFIHTFQKLTEDEQLRLLQIIASPAQVRSAIKQIKDEVAKVRRIARKAWNI